MELAKTNNKSQPVQGIAIPGLSLAEYERLALLAEECGEVIQVIGKILRHGYDSHHPDGTKTNRNLLATELGHVRHAMLRVCDAGDIDRSAMNEAMQQKSVNVGCWLHHQRPAP